jgi:beta-galactosidase
LNRTQFSRRRFVQSCAAALASVPVLQCWGTGEQAFAGTRGRAQRVLSLDQDWLFGGKLPLEALENAFDETAVSRVTLPHCVTPLSWQKWDPSAWEGVWSYCRRFSIPPEFKGLRVFVHFDRIMAGASPKMNGHELPQHLGGFLPFEYEVTDLVNEKDNVLLVAVDARWMNVPPAGSPKGPPSVDYLLPGGISGSVSLRAVPHVFIREVFAKPVNVLDPNRQLEVTCRIDAATPSRVPIRLVASLRDHRGVVARASKNVELEKADEEVSLTVSGLTNIKLWDVERPQLYELVVTLFLENKPLHDYRTRIGFREARFDLDGFFLNGRRLRLFGLNRHELYPYVGFSMPGRVQRKDAEMLRREFNCNIVRCSHYPQSEAFLDACDELGLMVWQETPGWQYLGDQNWQDLAVGNVRDMILRDRNRPSVIIWGVRINESANDPALYRRTREIAKSLDDSRPTSGTMTPSSLKNWEQEWHQDVFAFDDYHAAPDGSVGIREPLPGVPYLIAEAVGQFNYGAGKGFGSKYRRAGDPALQAEQALLHAQAHSNAAAYPRCAGVIAWCAFDYASLINAYAGVKCPGVADIFRIPKLGAAFYRAQVDPEVRPVIEPSFYWDFGPRMPSGPGARAAIFSNCERLDVSIPGRPHTSLYPDREGFPNLKYPPFFADLTVDGTNKPELRIDGYLGNRVVLSRSFSADTSADRLWLHADDAEVSADGSDATRVAFGAVDKFGVTRPFVEGKVSFEIKGPGVIIGDNPFELTDSGGAGAVWIKAVPGRTGRINIEASHASLGKNSIDIQVRSFATPGSVGQL